MRKLYYHGTHEKAAKSLLARGFDLNKEMWGRGWGNGVYLSGTIEFARIWGPVIVTCELKKGTKILWHSNFDNKIISYLAKEFKADIKNPDFWKCIPKNKQLKKRELIEIWNYLVQTHYGDKAKFTKGVLKKFQRNYPYIYENLKRHQFDGVGFKDSDWPEVLVFNPSLVNPLELHW